MVRPRSSVVRRSEHNPRCILPLESLQTVADPNATSDGDGKRLKMLSFGHVNPNSGAPGAVGAAERPPYALNYSMDDLTLGRQIGCDCSWSDSVKDNQPDAVCYRMGRSGLSGGTVKVLPGFSVDNCIGIDWQVVDMPPGTGDVQISLSQGLSFAGCVIVTTPHRLSLVDAAKVLSFVLALLVIIMCFESLEKGVAMLEELRVPTLALVPPHIQLEMVF